MGAETYFVLVDSAQYIPAETVTGPLSFDKTCEFIRDMHPMTRSCYRVIRGVIDEDFPKILADDEE